MSIIDKEIPMAILQVVTASKADGEFVTFEEAQSAYVTDASADALKSALMTSLAGNEFTVELGWDVESQTITYSRTWQPDAYDAFNAAQSTNKTNAQSSAEAAGWVVTETISTV